MFQISLCTINRCLLLQIRTNVIGLNLLSKWNTFASEMTFHFGRCHECLLLCQPFVTPTFHNPNSSQSCPTFFFIIYQNALTLKYVWLHILHYSLHQNHWVKSMVILYNKVNIGIPGLMAFIYLGALNAQFILIYNLCTGCIYVPGCT